MAITLGLVEAVDDNGVYVSMPGSRGALRGPYRGLSTVDAGMRVLLATTDDGETVVVGPMGGGLGVYNVCAFGAVGDGETDDSDAIQSAIDACLAAGGGTVYIPPGRFKIDTTLNLTNIHPEWDEDSGVSIAIRGAGIHATYLVGGEPDYGFMELVGSNRVRVADMAMVTGTGHTLQYGILSGRADGDASSGEHCFENIIIHGEFTLAAIFALASEECRYENCKVYTRAYGHGIVLAIDLDGWTDYTGSKYEPLTSTVPFRGGNGLNSLRNVSTITRTTTKSALWIEYVQTFSAIGLFTYTFGGPHVTMAKGSRQATFVAMQQEWSNALGGSEPYGVYVVADSYYYRFSVKDSDVYAVYAESASEIRDFSFISSRWKGGITYMVDVSSMYNSTIQAYGVGDAVPTPRYRARDGGSDNQVSPASFTTVLRDTFTTNLGPGRYVFDTTLGKPIWSTASAWVDATGTTV